eukprot:gene7452-2722_t
MATTPEHMSLRLHMKTEKKLDYQLLLKWFPHLKELLEWNMTKTVYNNVVVEPDKESPESHIKQSDLDAMIDAG